MSHLQFYCATKSHVWHGVPLPKCNQLFSGPLSIYSQTSIKIHPQLLNYSARRIETIAAPKLSPPTCGMQAARKTSSMEDRGQTDRVTALPCTYTLDIDLWPWPVTLIFNSRVAMIMIHTCTKTGVQRSVGSKDRVETNRHWHTAGRYRLLYLPG